MSQYVVCSLFICRLSVYDESVYCHKTTEVRRNPFELEAQFPIRLRPKLNWRLG